MRILGFVIVGLAAALGLGCSKTSESPPAAAASSAPASGSGDDLVKPATSCPAKAMTYLGFRGKGPPSPRLVREIRARFPEAIVVEVKDGDLGVVIAEPHSWDVRHRHEAAAEAVGWKGDVVDFPHVAADCKMTFTTPMPPPRP